MRAANFESDFEFGASASAERGGAGDLSRAAETALSSKPNSSRAGTANGAVPVPGANSFQSRWQAALNTSIAMREAQSPHATDATSGAQVVMRPARLPMQALLTAESPAVQNIGGTITTAPFGDRDWFRQPSHSMEKMEEDGSNVGNPILPTSHNNPAMGPGATVARSRARTKNAGPIYGAKTSETCRERRAEHSSKSNAETVSQAQGAEPEAGTTSLATLETTINPVVPVFAELTAANPQTASAFSSVTDPTSAEAPGPEIGTRGVERSGSGAAKIQAHAPRVGMAVHAAGATQASGAILQDDEQNEDLGLRSPATGLPFAQDPRSLPDKAALYEEQSTRPVVGHGSISNSLGGIRSGTNGLDFASMQAVAGSPGADTQGIGDGDVRQSISNASSMLAHRQESSEPSSPAAQAVPMQLHHLGADALVGAHVLANPLGASHTAPNQVAVAATSVGGNPTTAAHDVFASMDTGTSVGTPGWIHAGGHQAEAGFQDPALGWVGVRADLSGGGVHAALIPGSTEAAQALSTHLPGLSTYLADEHKTVATLTMAAPENGGIETGVGRNMQQSGGHSAQQNFPSDPQPTSPAAPESVPAAPTSANNEGFVPMAPTAGARGAHISVMA